VSDRKAQQRGALVVISGPSGVGKTTIVREALRRSGAGFSVSATTRRPRQGEVDGRDYHFVTEAAFRRMIERGELLEWAEVFGRLYGTPAGPVEQAIAKGRTMVLDIDVQGALQVHRKMPQATFVLIAPPDEATLSARLRGRGSDSPETIASRLAQAKKELAAARGSGVYNHEIVNDDLEVAIRQVVEIMNQECTQR
jgi:guanylate kinase